MNAFLDRVHQSSKNQKGFTLIELLMVIVILGVLAGIVVFAVSGINDRGETAACRSDVKTLEVAQEAHYANTTSYATTLTQLKDAGLIHNDSVLASGVTLGAAGVVINGPEC